MAACRSNHVAKCEQNTYQPNNIIGSDGISSAANRGAATQRDTNINISSLSQH